MEQILTSSPSGPMLEIAGCFDLTKPTKTYQNRFGNTQVLTFVHTMDGVGRIGTIAPPIQTTIAFPHHSQTEILERSPTNATSRSPSQLTSPL